MRRSTSLFPFIAALLAGGGVILFIANAPKAEVVGSPHDFSVDGGPYTQSGTIAPSGVCSACHVPHGSDGYALWARNLVNYRSSLDVDGGGTYQISYVDPPTIQCYACPAAHATGNIADYPPVSAFSSSHRPQDIAFGTDGPGGIPGYYEAPALLAE